jgi:hypothetical protein
MMSKVLAMPWIESRDVDIDSVLDVMNQATESEVLKIKNEVY